jgi:hypothetical protein
MPDDKGPQSPTLPRGYGPPQAMSDLIAVVLATVPAKPADQDAADALGRLAAFAERQHRRGGGHPAYRADPRGMGTPHGDQHKEGEE